LGGHDTAERLRLHLACAVRHEDTHPVVTARLDQEGLGGLLHRLGLIGADLLSLHRTR
jgi:hypothetical protein